jgi:hypothetical protein
LSITCASKDVFPILLSPLIADNVAVAKQKMRQFKL